MIGHVATNNKCEDLHVSYDLLQIYDATKIVIVSIAQRLAMFSNIMSDHEIYNRRVLDDKEVCPE